MTNEDICSSSLIRVTKKQKEAIRKDVNLQSDEEIKKRIDEILKWYTSQEHLPSISLDRKVVERILISRKGCVAKTKEKVESMFTIRTKMSELSCPRDIYHEDIQRVFKAITIGTLPALNKDNCRIVIMKYTDDHESYDLKNCCNYMFMTMEYRLQHDYSSGDRFIFDIKDKTWRHYRKDIPHLAIKCLSFFQSSYGIRLKSIHLVNAPSYIGKIIAMFRFVLPKKFMDRMLVHSTYEDLHTTIDKDILPVEYGGKEKTLKDIMYDWNKELAKDDIRRHLILQETLRSDETKRRK